MRDDVCNPLLRSLEKVSQEALKVSWNFIEIRCFQNLHFIVHEAGYKIKQ